MRYREFVTEQQATQAELPKQSKYYPDMPANDPYQLYRFSLNVANPAAATQGPASQDAVISPYSSVDADLIAQAERATGKKGKSMNSKQQTELSHSGSTSPLPAQPPIKSTQRSKKR